MIAEKDIEKLLVKEVKKLGGLCWKFVSPGVSGVPDRLCLLSHGKAIFVEVKREGQTLRPLQKKRKRDLEKLGFKVYVLDSKEKVKEIIDELQTL